jgi:hypothetical protein
MWNGKTSSEETLADPGKMAGCQWAASVTWFRGGSRAPRRLVDQPIVGLQWPQKGQAL